MATTSTALVVVSARTAPATNRVRARMIVLPVSCAWLVIARFRSRAKATAIVRGYKHAVATPPAVLKPTRVTPTLTASAIDYAAAEAAPTHALLMMTASHQTFARMRFADRQWNAPRTTIVRACRHVIWTLASVTSPTCVPPMRTAWVTVCASTRSYGPMRGRQRLPRRRDLL